jgi:dienelactone hydrolase
MMKHSPETPIESEGRPIFFKSEGQKIAGTLFSPKEWRPKHPGVLIMHGWKSGRKSHASIARKLADIGFASMTFDFRGHGESEGDPENLSRGNFLNDAIAAYETLSHMDGIYPKEMNAIAGSFGAYIAAILSEQKAFHSLVFRVPADYPDEGFETPGLRTSDEATINAWRSSPRSFDSTSALRGIHRFQGDILIVESGADTVVPRETVQSYIDAAPDPKKVSHILMEGAPHTLSGSPTLKDEYEKDVVEWFLKQYPTE